MLDQTVTQTSAEPHQPHRTSSASDEDAGFTLAWATTWPEVREAQRLRYRVFAGEMGARVPSRRHGLDADEFDAYCDHLLVREPADGAVVGTYRVLAPDQAQAAGGLYSDQEFDLSPLAGLRPRMAELGRACVDARFRHGGVVLALWAALTRYMLARDLEWMIGCCSLPLRDEGGRTAAGLWHALRHTHLVEPGLRVRPLLPFPVDSFAADSRAEPPPLLKGYLRLGARVMGPPAWDSDFGCADLPVLMRVADLPTRYRNHFLTPARVQN